MKKAIAIHIVFLILYLIAFLYVTDGVDVTPFGRFVNVLLLVFVQTCVSAYCDLNELYKQKQDQLPDPN